MKQSIVLNFFFHRLTPCPYSFTQPLRLWPDDPTEWRELPPVKLGDSLAGSVEQDDDDSQSTTGPKKRDDADETIDEEEREMEAEAQEREGKLVNPDASDADADDDADGDGDDDGVTQAARAELTR